MAQILSGPEAKRNRAAQAEYKKERAETRKRELEEERARVRAHKNGLKQVKAKIKKLDFTPILEKQAGRQKSRQSLPARAPNFELVLSPGQEHRSSQLAAQSPFYRRDQPQDHQYGTSASPSLETRLSSLSLAAQERLEQRMMMRRRSTGADFDASYDVEVDVDTLLSSRGSSLQGQPAQQQQRDVSREGSSRSATSGGARAAASRENSSTLRRHTDTLKEFQHQREARKRVEEVERRQRWQQHRQALETAESQYASDNNSRSPASRNSPESRTRRGGHVVQCESARVGSLVAK